MLNAAMPVSSAMVLVWKLGSRGREYLLIPSIVNVGPVADEIEKHRHDRLLVMGVRTMFRFPGGVKLKTDEDTVATARRSFASETGLVLGALQQTPVYVHDEPGFNATFFMSTDEVCDGVIGRCTEVRCTLGEPDLIVYAPLWVCADQVRDMLTNAACLAAVDQAERILGPAPVEHAPFRVTRRYGQHSGGGGLPTLQKRRSSKN